MAETGQLAGAGRVELDRRAHEEAEIRTHRVRENEQAVRSQFCMDFFRDRYVYDQAQRKYVVPAANAIPPFEDVRVHDEGYYFGDAGRAPVSFTCDGLRWICRWEFKGTRGDTAWWDDGWWTQWFLIVRRRRRWLPLLRRDVEVQVWGPANVAEATA